MLQKIVQIILPLPDELHLGTLGGGGGGTTSVVATELSVPISLLVTLATTL